MGTAAGDFPIFRFLQLVGRTNHIRLMLQKSGARKPIYLLDVQGTLVKHWAINYTRWWFQRFFIFTPIWGRFPIWLIFFRWVETTNQYTNKPINWCFGARCLKHQQWIDSINPIRPTKMVLQFWMMISTLPIKNGETRYHQPIKSYKKRWPPGLPGYKYLHPKQIVSQGM